MAWTLHLVVWISIVTASGYKYPLSNQQLRFAPFPVDEHQGNFRPGPDCGRLNSRSAGPDSRMNERSIAPSNTRVQEEVRVYQTRIEEPLLRRSENGSSKILNNFLKPGRRRGQVDNNQITFPGPTAPSAFRNQYVPEIPESCRKSTFCEDIPNYPQAAVDKLISELGEPLNLQVDKLDIPDTPDINQRLGPTEDNVELCNFIEKVVYPQGAKGADGKWYTLVNRKDNPVQGFRVEICQEDGSKCSDIAIFQTGYVARCKQKYVLRTATAIITRENGTVQLVEKQVKVPSCCSCVAKVTIT